MDWIEVFRSGTHKDSNGNEKTYKDKDLDSIVDSYDPDNEAPVVLGHPKTDSPAYGWVEGLKRSGGVLLAKMNLLPEMVEFVKRGLYKKRSIALNPGLKLRHIGFLGGVPPAIKGLKNIAFSEEEEVSFNFEDENMNDKIMDKLTEMGETIKEAFTKKEVQVSRKDHVEVAEHQEALARVDELRIYREETQAKMEELKLANDKLELVVAEQRKQGIHKDNSVYAESLGFGPYLNERIVKVLDSVSQLSSDLEFEEGKKTVTETLKEVFDKFRNEDQFKEFAAKEKAQDPDPDAQLTELINKYAEEKNISFADAYPIVASQHRDLTDQIK